MLLTKLCHADGKSLLHEGSYLSKAEGPVKCAMVTCGGAAAEPVQSLTG